VVVRGYEVWSVTSREEQRLKVCENRVLRILLVLRKMNYRRLYGICNEKICNATIREVLPDKRRSEL
jgi:hypothetical protein